MIGYYLSSNHKTCYSTQTQTFSPTKHPLSTIPPPLPSGSHGPRWLASPAEHRQQDPFTARAPFCLWYAKRGHPAGPTALPTNIRRGHRRSAAGSTISLIARTNSHPAARFTTRTHEIHTAPRTDPHHRFPPPFLGCLALPDDSRRI